MVNITAGVPFFLVNLMAGTYLTRTSGDFVVGNSYSPDLGQEWEFEPAGSPNQWLIRASDWPNRYLGAPTLSQGVQLMASPTQFVWNSVNVYNENRVAQFTAKGDPGLWIDLFNGDPTSGTKVQLQVATGSQAQYWILQDVTI